MALDQGPFNRDEELKMSMMYCNWLPYYCIIDIMLLKTKDVDAVVLEKSVLKQVPSWILRFTLSTRAGQSNSAFKRLNKT